MSQTVYEIDQHPDSSAKILMKKLGTIKDQASEDSKLDNDVIGFENFSIKNNDTISLMCFFIVIIAIICYLHRTK